MLKECKTTLITKKSKAKYVLLQEGIWAPWSVDIRPRHINENSRTTSCIFLLFARSLREKIINVNIFRYKLLNQTDFLYMLVFFCRDCNLEVMITWNFYVIIARNDDINNLLRAFSRSILDNCYNADWESVKKSMERTIS